jgi:hypothetical protein
MSLCDVPNDLLPMIVEKLSSRAAEVDDLMQTCARLAMAGAPVTTALAALLAEEVNVRTQMLHPNASAQAVADACSPNKKADRRGLATLAAAAGMRHQGVPVYMLRDRMRHREDRVGEACRVPLCAALFVLDMRYRYVSLTVARAMHPDRDLSGCRTSGKLLRLKDVRDAPVLRVDNARSAGRDVLDAIGGVFKRCGLAKPWHVRTLAQCAYEIKRHRLRAHVVGAGLPPHWCETYQFRTCLHRIVTIKRGDSGDSVGDGGDSAGAYDDIDDPCTAALVDQFSSCRDALVYVNITPAFLHARDGDLFRVANASIERALQKPGCFTTSPDASLTGAPSVAAVAALDLRISEGWAAYQLQEKAFGPTAPWAFRFVCTLTGVSIARVLQHAAAFNAVLVEVEATRGVAVDVDAYSVASHLYRSPHVNVSEIAGMVQTAAWIQASLRGLQTMLPLVGSMPAMVTVMSHIWRGSFPHGTPAHAPGLVYREARKRRHYVRKRPNAKDGVQLQIGDVLEAIDEIVFRSLAATSSDASSGLLVLRLDLARIVTRAYAPWLRRAGMTLAFGELQGLDAYLSTGRGALVDVPLDIISFSRL